VEFQPNEAVSLPKKKAKLRARSILRRYGPARKKSAF
jgi:hypothetical protein